MEKYGRGCGRLALLGVHGSIFGTAREKFEGEIQQRIRPILGDSESELETGWAIPFRPPIGSILGTLDRQMSDRALACDNWRRGKSPYDEIQRRGELDYNGQYFAPYLRDNLRRCDSGAPVSEFRAMD